MHVARVERYGQSRLYAWRALPLVVLIVET